MRLPRHTLPALTLTALGLLAACASAPESSMKPVTLVTKVDIPRYMGDWFVIANIPTSLESGAYNSKDSYTLQPDGTIATTFSYNADGFTGARKTYDSKGFVLDGTGAVWGQQYVWPVKADYRISYLSPDYKQVVVTREKRDYVWIMSRTPTISEADLAKLTAFVGTQGYDVSKLRRVPQASGR